MTNSNDVLVCLMQHKVLPTLQAIIMAIMTTTIYTQ